VRSSGDVTDVELLLLATVMAREADEADGETAACLFLGLDPQKRLVPLLPVETGAEAGAADAGEVAVAAGGTEPLPDAGRIRLLLLLRLGASGAGAGAGDGGSKTLGAAATGLVTAGASGASRSPRSQYVVILPFPWKLQEAIKTDSSVMVSCTVESQLYVSQL